MPHPYEEEINQFRPDWKTILDELSTINPQVPRPVEESVCEFIDTKEQLDELMVELRKHFLLAVDLEFHAYRSYQGFTCLMQMSTRFNDYIIDTIALRSELHVLNEVFTNPKVTKVLHGSKSDIVWLQKDFGVYIVNLFDTGEASKVLGLKGSLGFLLKHYCDVITDKKFQLADWRQRPLPEEMMKYA